MSVARWDDDHCPSSQREDGGHCAHADTHDVCDWCGAQWGEGGAMLVPVDRLRGAVEAIGHALGLIETASSRARIIQARDVLRAAHDRLGGQ